MGIDLAKMKAKRDALDSRGGKSLAAGGWRTDDSYCSYF